MIDAQRAMELAGCEMLKFRGEKILLKIGLPDACILVAQLQLAIRHPNNPAAQTSRHHCDAIIYQIEKLSHDLADFLRLGFDTQYDTK